MPPPPSHPFPSPVPLSRHPVVASPRGLDMDSKCLFAVGFLSNKMSSPPASSTPASLLPRPLQNHTSPFPRSLPSRSLTTHLGNLSLHPFLLSTTTSSARVPFDNGRDTLGTFLRKVSYPHRHHVTPQSFQHLLSLHQYRSASLSRTIPRSGLTPRHHPRQRPFHSNHLRAQPRNRTPSYLSRAQKPVVSLHLRQQGVTRKRKKKDKRTKEQPIQAP